MRFKMIKDGRVYYPLVERSVFFGLFGSHWDYIFPNGWLSGETMCFYTQEDAEECIAYNKSIGNHIERCYEINPPKTYRNSDFIVKKKTKKRKKVENAKS